ncbi:MAG: 1-aminocyclopropane-1-carboxylate deaminase [Candidatus Pelagibacter sp.]|nr:1-aminocyclopropane-1-carboxylate deaminase [Candidatus Pelagibacter sp.]
MKSSKRSKVDPFIVMDVMEAARKAESKGKHIIHMEVGQPGTPAPKHAKNNLLKELDNNNLGYTVTLGLPELRDRISKLYGEWYNLDLDPNRIVITTGSSGAFILSFASLFDAGARVGIGSPGYPSYRQILKSQSLVPVDIETKIENKFQPTSQDIKNNNLDGLLVASPANPTGSMLDKSSFEELINISLENNVSFISDEIYHGIQYEFNATSALEISNNCYVINSFSKYFSMTGWRIGWMVVPKEHVRQVERLAQNLFICPPHVSQVTALSALDAKEELTSNFNVYKKNREILLKELPEAGFKTFSPPDGAFYIYVDISKFSNDSYKFCSDILNQAGVAITPGLDFDQKRGNSTIRFSYARSTKDIVEGAKRIKNFMIKNYG